MNDLYNNERLIEQSNIDSHIENEHKHRYKTAALLVKGKRVLDAAFMNQLVLNIPDKL